MSGRREDISRRPRKTSPAFILFYYRGCTVAPVITLDQDEVATLALHYKSVWRAEKRCLRGIAVCKLFSSFFLLRKWGWEWGERRRNHISCWSCTKKQATPPWPPTSRIVWESASVSLHGIVQVIGFTTCYIVSDEWDTRVAPTSFSRDFRPRTSVVSDVESAHYSLRN